ncbi:MAG: hypothetical protein H8D45_12605 [Bacteroidetes bacterium]|nr:hypothetical protein [Bacteroidota bacterium]MBL7104461.1 hypothetical protein [Bacteroidales bacterium]
MGCYERSIKIAFDKLSGEILEADKVFDNKKDAFAVRRQFHKNEVELYCCECEQKLNVSTSKYDRLHFKHQPNADYCILKDGNLTPEQIEQFNRILVAKESPRHKELKNKIAERLLGVEGIDTSSIAIDNKFIIRGNEKRRPDVYCKYYDKELVFEIQLSDLSLRYILSRYEFYKKHGMYLIWILDNFDIHRQAQLERDIKYLTKYENFFKLDEKTDIFKLECKYKFPFLTENNKLLTKWIDKSVSLNQLNFDSESYQIYYYNFGDNKSKTEEEQKRKAEQIKEAERIKLADERLATAKSKSKEIIQDIKELRNRKSQNFISVNRLINELDKYELEILNSTLNLHNRDKLKKPALYNWISTATQDDVAFIEFILNCGDIKIDVNDKDSEGRTALQEVYQNKAIHKYILVKGLLKRGYKLTKEDEAYISSLSDSNGEIKNDLIIYTICRNLTDKDLVDFVFLHSKLLFIIESARRKEIIGFKYKPNEWIAFANNAIQYHSDYWEYIELAFKDYGLWDKLIELDKKGTFQKKVQAFYSKMPRQKFDFDNVYRDLYPELTN